MMHVGDILSTVRDVQYRGGYLEYHGVFSTVRDIMSTMEVYLESRGGHSVPWGIT